MVHNDTSTGVQNPVKQVCTLAGEAGALTFVDSVSGLGGAELEFDSWGVDVCAGASQKCIGGTPGVSFVAVSERALKKIQARSLIPSIYFDLRKYEQFGQTNHQTPYTPAESIYNGLDVSLQDYLVKGRAFHWARHKRAANMVRKALVKKGFGLFAQKGFESSTLTTFVTQDAPALKQTLLQKGFEIGVGMGEYRQTVGRIGHMGSFSMPLLRRLLEEF
jgi:aspartate aminotransferase-like enzyme